MRDIKFRTYVRFLREMHEVREMIFDKGTVMINAYQYGLDKDDAPVMQFTGLQDKKGNDIYEDDICTVAGMGLAIVDICRYNGTQFKTLDGYDVPVIDCVAEDDDFEIVGNIHQNRELLEKNQCH